jgi:ATP-dependent exoDNAse (exonuclease V) beta subunit
MAELAGGRAPGRLVLTTYHSAKGREISAVVLPGLVEGLVPFYFADQGITPRELERARRLFYVAVTRAMDAVVLIPGNHFTAWGPHSPHRLIPVRRRHPTRDQPLGPTFLTTRARPVTASTARPKSKPASASSIVEAAPAGMWRRVSVARSGMLTVGTTPWR